MIVMTLSYCSRFLIEKEKSLALDGYSEIELYFVNFIRFLLDLFRRKTSSGMSSKEISV